MPLDLSDMVANARRSAGIASPERLAAEAKTDELLALAAVARTLPEALGHLPPRILLAWGQSLTDDAKAGLGYYAPLLDMIAAELHSRPGEVANDG